MQPTHVRVVPLNGRRQTGHARCTSEDVATASSTSSAVDGSSELAARIRRPRVGQARETRRPATRSATCVGAGAGIRAEASIVAVHAVRSSLAVQLRGVSSGSLGRPRHLMSIQSVDREISSSRMSIWSQLSEFPRIFQMDGKCGNTGNDANVFPRASYLSAFAPPSLRDTVCGAPNARTNARRRHLAGHAFEDGVDDGCERALRALRR